VERVSSEIERGQAGSRLGPGLVARLDGRDWSRIASILMAAAVGVYVPLAVWLTRGAAFYSDNLHFFAESGSLAPSALVAPYTGHLTATVRLLYELNLRIFGADPLPFQLEEIAASAAVAILLFALVSRWRSAVLALPLSVVVLVLGCTPDNLQSYAIMWPLSIAGGLAALLVLTNESRRRDPLACGLLVLSVLTLEIGLAFAFAAALFLLGTRERWRRLWVPAAPALLYALWWLWAQRFDEPALASLANLGHLPAFAFDSIASGVTAFTGIAAFHEGAAIRGAAIEWGRPLAVAFLLLILVAVVRGGRSARTAAAAGFVSIFIVAGGLSYMPVFREPTAPRYVYPIVIGMVLVFAAASAGWPTSRSLPAVVAVCCFAAGANLALLRDQAAEMRVTDGQVEAGLAVIELERNRVPPDFAVPFRIPDPNGYLAAARRWGSLTYPPSELSAQSVADRQYADGVLGDLLQPRLRRRGVGNGACVASAPGPADEVTLPAGGGVVESNTGGAVLLRRFGDVPSIPVGVLSRNEPAAIDLPVDGSSRPWRAAAGLFACR